MSPLQYVSLGVCLLLALGLYTRDRKHTHIPFMLSAFIIDMLMLLGIELNRGAIGQMSGPTSGLLKFHIVLSVVVVLLYFFQIVTGWGKVRGRSSRFHGYAGWLLFVLRIGNFITSIMVMHEKSA